MLQAQKYMTLHGEVQALACSDNKTRLTHSLCHCASYVGIGHGVYYNSHFNQIHDACELM